jgi:hypothetical protein
MRSAPTGSSTIYYDGILLVEGQRPIKSLLSLMMSMGQKETGGEPFENLIRSLTEGSWPWVRKWADRLINENFQAVHH